MKRGTYLLGHQDKETYLKNHFGPYEAYRYCNTQLPENATFLLMGEPRLAYLERRAIFSDVFVKPIHDVWLSDHSSPQTMKEALQEKGVTHLMVTRKGLQQLAGKWGFSRWTEAQRLHWSEFCEATELLYEKIIGKSLK